jgi:membrane fusion protein (multidrug efflux system)
MKKVIFFTGLVLLSFFFESCGEEAPKVNVVAEIPVVVPKQQNLPIYVEYVGSTFGYKDIPIRARVEGFLESINFNEGFQVQAGQLLYTIDSQPFQADVAASQSVVAEAETKLVNAENELARYKPLGETNAVSKSDVDAAQATRDAAVASLDAAKANLRMSQIKLSYATLESPITGIIGKTNARVGEYVGKDPNPVILNTVSRIDTIRVQFFVTESDYLSIAKQYMNRTKPNKPRERAHVELILSDETKFDQEGIVDFIDRNVDSQTGSILIQASFPNPDFLLRPGMFTKVRVKMTEVPDAILIPSRCVMEIQGRSSIYVVTKENKIENRQITVGQSIGDMIQVISGLKPGEPVVIDALQKVKSDMVVQPKIVEFSSQSTLQN